MGQRSRKKGRRGPPPRPSAGTRQATETRPARGSHGGRGSRPAGDEAPLSRSQRKDAAARATLVPLEPHERPWPIVVSALIACALGGVTIVLYAVGTRLTIGGSKPSIASVIPYSVIMLACGIGTWYKRYWAVLGFQTLLAVGLLGASLALIKVTSVFWGIVVVAVIAGFGYLFWSLVRILGRIQMPTPPQRR